MELRFSLERSPHAGDHVCLMPDFERGEFQLERIPYNSFYVISGRFSVCGLNILGRSAGRRLVATVHRPIFFSIFYNRTYSGSKPLVMNFVAKLLAVCFLL